MNSLRILSTLVLLHGVVLHVAHAQAIRPGEPAAPNTTAAAAAEPVVMSPFTVATSSDQGYLATETQAGTRLRTQIADTPVALSILTNDFMNDIAATGLDSLVPFIPSTESFTLLGGDNSGNSAKTGDTLTVRGFKTNTRTRNFFQTLGFNDRYLTDRVTFSRGPNALLFGIGNPGGSVHIATNRAEFGNRHGDLKYQYDSHGSHRLTFDQNYEVIDDTGRFASTRCMMIQRVSGSPRTIARTASSLRPRSIRSIATGKPSSGSITSMANGIVSRPVPGLRSISIRTGFASALPSTIIERRPVPAWPTSTIRLSGWRVSLSISRGSRMIRSRHSTAHGEPAITAMSGRRDRSSMASRKRMSASPATLSP